MGRAPCCDKDNVKRGPWSPDEDAKLKAYIDKHGTGGNWIALPPKIGLKRCGKSCRLRWLNYLRPNIRHGGFSEEEDNVICSLYIAIGSRWSIIAAQLPGRTDNDIKNYWNTKLKKKLLGKQRNQRVRQARYLKQEMNGKREDLLATDEAINTHAPLHEPVVPLSPLNPSEKGTIDYEQFSKNTNNYYVQNPCHIFGAQDQLYLNVTNGNSSTSSSLTTDCYSVNWVGSNNLQGYNMAPGQINEITYNNTSQHFDGFESFSGMEMVNTSSTMTNTSAESASWEDISSFMYLPASTSNLEVCQQQLIIMPNCTGYNTYMPLQ